MQVLRRIGSFADRENVRVWHNCHFRPFIVRDFAFSASVIADAQRIRARGYCERSKSSLAWFPGKNHCTSLVKHHPTRTFRQTADEAMAWRVIKFSRLRVKRHHVDDHGLCTRDFDDFRGGGFWISVDVTIGHDT